MDLIEINGIITRALALLPTKMDTAQARMMVMATGFQESKFLVRKQMGNGPARSFWQFEEGNAKAHNAMWGVMNLPATKALAESVADSRGVLFNSRSIWSAMETDDVLGAAFARLLLWTDAKALPGFDDEQAGWEYYIRCWNPGKPRPAEWPQSFRIASAFYRSM